MDELPLSFANVLGQCAVNGFYAGIIGNLAASGVQWSATKSRDKLKGVVLQGAGLALKNHDLVRALVRSQFEAVAEIIDLTLLEDFVAEPSASRNWITHLSCLLPGKALRDHSNPHIKKLWEIRSLIEDRLKKFSEISAVELDRNLVVAITNAQAIASPDLSNGVEGPYAQWSQAASESMCELLRGIAAPSDIPERIIARISSGEWAIYFRVAFRQELKKDEDAETAYFINVHDTLATYAHQHAADIGDISDSLKKGFNREDEKISEVRSLLFSLRSHVKNLETATGIERSKVVSLVNAQEAGWRRMLSEQQQHWQKAHDDHSFIIKRMSKADQKMAGIAFDVKAVKDGIREVQEKAARLSRFDHMTANIIRHLKKEFWGRRWLFAQITEFRKKNHATGGYIVITGLPGQGKSAIAAQLADEESSLVHLFRRDTVFSDLNSLHAHLLEQAAAQFQVASDGSRKGKSPTDLLQSLFWELSGQMTFPLDCLVVIDALDEAAPEALRAGINPLGLPQKLGRGIFVVLTSRERDDCKLADCGDTPVLHIELHRSSDSKRDATDYIRHHLADPRVGDYIIRNKVSTEEFTRTLLAKSECNFMYLRHVLPELAGGILVGTKLDHFPEGLRKYYALLWQSMINDAQGADLGWKMAVLAVLAALQEQCGATTLWEIVQRLPAVLEKLHPSSTVQNTVLTSTVEDVHALFAEWQEFLLTDYEPELEPESRIYHLEFSEFLRSEPLRKPIDFVLVTAEAFFDWQMAGA